MSRIYFGSKNFSLSSIQNEFNNMQIVQMYDVKKQISLINRFFDADKIFLYLNPDNEEIKLIENQIAKDIGLNFLYFDNESFDGRVSLIQKIKKNNSIYDMSYPLIGDFLSFKRHILSYLRSKNVKIDSDCLEWLKENSPIYRNKSKISKKEELQYDLDILFREIDKISSYANEIYIKDFENSFFKKDNDIFQLIDFMLDGNFEKSIKLYDNLKQSTGEQAVLMIILYQIVFLINLVGAKNKCPYDVDKIIEHIELKDLLGKYLDSDWNRTNFTVKNQNPIRVKIALSKYNLEIDKLTNIFNQLVQTILNLRSVSDNSIAGFLLINKVCNA